MGCCQCRTSGYVIRPRLCMSWPSSQSSSFTVTALRPQPMLLPAMPHLRSERLPPCLAVPPAPPPSLAWSAPSRSEVSRDEDTPVVRPRSETSSVYSDDGGFRNHVFVCITFSIESRNTDTISLREYRSLSLPYNRIGPRVLLLSPFNTMLQRPGRSRTSALIPPVPGLAM